MVLVSAPVECTGHEPGPPHFEDLTRHTFTVRKTFTIDQVTANRALQLAAEGARNHACDGLRSVCKREEFAGPADSKSAV